MKKWFLFLALIITTTAHAYSVDLEPSQDTFVDSTNRTFNYGGVGQYYLGNRNATAESAALMRFDYAGAGIPRTAEVTSAICTLYCRNIENADGWRVRARMLDSAWVEGSALGSYQPGSTSWNNQGYGLSCDNIEVSTADSCWGLCGAGLVPPCGGPWNHLVADSDAVSSVFDSFLVFNLTEEVQQQISSGQNFGFHFFGASPFNSRRVIVATREFPMATYHPKLSVTYGSGERDSTLLRISVSLPSAPLSDFPVLVSFLTFPGLAGENLTFYAGDSTAKLYWWPDSIAGHYTRVWVTNDWNSANENIFVRRSGDPSHMQADSVFMFFDDFNEDQTLAQPCLDFDNWTATLRDTSGPFLTFNPNDWDSLYRENSRFIYDTQESNPNLRYKWFYAGKKVHADPSRYANIFLTWASCPTLDGTWTKHGVLVDASGDSMNLEDPDIIWVERYHKWFMVCENHNAYRSNTQYYLGLYTADSLDGTWTFSRNIADSSSLGYPYHWLNREQASPAIWLNEATDTMFCFFEGFDYYSRCGLMVSFGDSIGYQWHFTDSTGAVNDTNPTPIIPWGISGQKDSVDSTPDGFYRNPDGEYWMIGHANGPNLIYKGDSPYTMRYVPADSIKWGDNYGFDPQSGYWVGAAERGIWQGNPAYSAVFINRIVDFDSTRWNNPKWTVHHRTARLTSYNRFVGSWTGVKDGVMMLTGSPWQTSSTSLQTTSAFDQGFVVEMKMQCTNLGDDILPHLNISLGDDTLQDYLGGQIPQSAWYDTESQRGNSLYIDDLNSKFYRQTPGAARVSTGATFAVPLQTLNSMHKWSIYYTTNDSLWCFVDGERKAAIRDLTYTGMPRQLTLSQGERLDYSRGGVTRVDWVRVRKYTTAEGVATASDTLFFGTTIGIHPPLEPVRDLVIIPQQPEPNDVTLLWTHVEHAGGYDVYMSTSLDSLTEAVNFEFTTHDTTAILTGALADTVSRRYITVVPVEPSAPSR